jgi:diguanylate cyclase (GGDEF)-like protein
MLHAYEHFYKSDGSIQDQPLGTLTKNQFDREIGDALQSQLVEHLAYNEDQKHREYFGNRYEIQPRVATERLHQLLGLRSEKESIEAQIREHIHSIHKLKEHVYMDKLVQGTLSEFGFEVKLKEAVESGNEPVSVGFIDLNNFKHINTEFSQKAGDEALQEFGRHAADVLRRHGLVAEECFGHFGGDEYGIVLNGVPLKRAKQIFKEIQALRLICEEAPAAEADSTSNKPSERPHRFRILPDDGSKAPEGTVVVTATLGAVVRRQAQSVEDVLQSADRVMFVVKEKVKQLSEGQSLTKVKAFSGHIERIMGKPVSDQLKRHSELGEISYSELHRNRKASEFRIQSKTMDEIRQTLNRAENKHKLLTDLLTKHRHTGIWNKDISKARLQKQINENEPFSILRISVDNFKPVNDVFESHAKGNAILKEVGAYLIDLQKRHADDIQFLGSLGGPAPFMVIKDAEKAEEIRREIDSFFLKVTAEDKPSQRIMTHREANKEAGEIAVGFSAAATRYAPASGLDAEGLLVTSKRPLDDVEEEHIRQGRHTKRTGDHKPESLEKQTRSTGNQGRRASDN